jgi:oxygen-independent coproporphyrinogen III oxidase
MRSSNPVGSAGLYVHIPFCLTKCPYCDFFSITDLSLVEEYLEALAREASLYEDQHQDFDTLYVGGGTPSMMSPSQMSRLFSILRSMFHFAEPCEVTVEVNPDDVTGEKVRALAGEGVNRLSIGVQSFRDKDLTFLGRRHGAKVATKAIETALDAGFENLSVDLIYPLPGQSRRSWLTCLEQAVVYPISHLSCYQLTIEERTPFGQMRKEGKLKTAGEKRETELFLETSQFLEERGFVHYEVSNFARGSSDISHHNSKYWAHVPYLGLGPAAHSFNGNTRWWNVRSVPEYCGLLKEGRHPTAGSEELTADQLRLERLYLGLRTKIGVSRSDIEESDNSGQTLLDLVDAKILEIIEDRIVPTRKGYLIADHLPLLFC